MEKSQETLAGILGGTQTIISARIILDVLALGGLLLYQGVPTLAQINALIDDNSTSLVIHDYLTTHRPPNPTTRRIIGRVLRELGSRDDPRSRAVSAWLSALTGRKAPKTSSDRRQDPDVLGQFRIKLEDVARVFVGAGAAVT